MTNLLTTKDHTRSLPVYTGLIFTGLMSLSLSSTAEDWTFHPELSATAKYNDNIGLDDDTEESTIGQTYSLNMLSSFQSDVQDFKAGMQLVSTIYETDDPGIDDTDNQYLSLNETYYWSELTTVGLHGTFGREYIGVTQNSDILPTDDVDDDQNTGLDPDTGLTDEQIRRKKLRLTPTVTHNFSELTQLGASYSYSKVSFEDDIPGPGLVEYEANSIGLKLSHSLRVQDQFFIELQGQNYEAEEIDRNIDTQTANVGLVHNLSELSSLIVSGGAWKTQYDSNQFEDSTGHTGRIELIVRGETLKFRTRLEQSVTPSASGVAQDTSRAVIRLNKRISEKFNLLFRATYIQSEGIGAGNNLLKREEYRIQPSLRYNFSETLSLDGTYEYRRRDRETDSNSASSNSVYLTLTYTPVLQQKR